MGKYTKGEKPLLSISLLVSNSIDTIRNCMESIKPLLEALPSELIVVDGGSKDGAIDIAREYADEIVPFIWCNDFSAARNAGLEKTSGEWFLYLDDDEWFEDVTEILDFFQSGEYKQYEHGWYVQRNYSNREGSSCTDCYVSRMHKIIPGFLFRGKIHEAFAPASSNVKQFSCYVHHYGYVYDTPEQKRQKSERNLSLVEEAHAENPKDLRMASQLVQEYMAIEQWEKAEAVIQTMIQQNKEAWRHPNMQYVIVCPARIENLQKKWEEEEKTLQYIEQTYPLEAPAKLVCMVEHIFAAAGREDFRMVLETLPKYFSLRKYMQEEGKQFQRKLVMDFCAYMSEDIERRMVDCGMQAMFMTDEYAMAKQLFEKINWAGNIKKVYLKLFLRAYEKDVASEAFFKNLEQVLQNPNLNPLLIEKLEPLLEYDVARKTFFIEQVEKLGRPEPFFKKLHIEYCLKHQSEAEVKEAIRSYFTISDGRYDKVVVAELLLEPLYVDMVLEKMDFDIFKECVACCLQEHETNIVLALLQEQESLWLANKKIPFLYFKMAVYEASLFAQEADEENLLWKYVEATLAFAKAYFGEVAFANNGIVLPANIQFALWMQQAALCKNAGDRVGWSERVKQAAEIYPPMISVIQAVLRKEANQQEISAISRELLQLAEQLKQQIRSLMTVGQTTEAQELVLALEQYVPQDVEVAELKEKLFT